MNWSRKLINPVIDKEFRLRMRSTRSMLSVLFYVLALGAIAMGFIYLFLYLGQQGPQRFDPQMSQMMFYVLSFAQLVLIAFMAPALTAGVISSEREKQTLSMLLTTQQSSATIVLSKLVSALSFMTLIVLATLPIYSIVFLYGGISPKQLVSVFAFYLFVMLLLGSLGVMFSTLFKRTIVAIIVTYGAGLIIFLVTGLLYLFFMGIEQRNMYQSGQTIVPGSYSWVGYVLGLNPAGAMMSLFNPSFSEDAFLLRGGSLNSKAPIELWLEFFIVYSVVIVLALWVAVRNIRPVARRKRKDKNETQLPQEPETAGNEG
ncbi:ABC transporter permease [Paenibacillus lautus]|uniref:ABC transporter permease n=1 Tax=Paenibacillus lautus TaxID=1401 RepID=A0A385TGA0_PAELA|nr:ABC transporter permease [Paenibacillus lautus]AYB42471.1 ABC transporter permease [Paenibacillus lautus]MBY0160826.1 ABC transporter permease [Cytobacillus firmus]VTR30074.1 ABC-type transport system involved in multi-copper enzyme maturation, permease component [Actinobacillus pleuropneumoniae]